jgi:hypothetical protein
VIDALWHLGVRDISLPVTSETVWRAVRDAAMRRESNDARQIVPPNKPDYDRNPAMRVDAAL